VTERIRRSYELRAPVDVVMAGLADEDTIRRRSAADGLGTRLVRHEVSEHAVRIVVATDLPLDWLPAALSSAIGASPTVERVEEWTRDADGASSPLTFTFSGLPVTCSGTARITPAGSGSRMDAYLTLSVDVPLLGGAVERAVSPQIVAALDAEAAYYGALSGSDR
jgi:hypothetical protein